jgi:hypothetical protein
MQGSNSVRQISRVYPGGDEVDVALLCCHVFHLLHSCKPVVAATSDRDFNLAQRASYGVEVESASPYPA